MKDIVLLLVLLSTQTIKTSSQPQAPGPDQNCSSLKYLNDDLNLCCNKCPPGQRLKKECTETSETVCEPCQPEQFMESWNYARNCFSCIKCKESKGLQFTQKCTSTTNSICACMPGRFCLMAIKGLSCQECTRYKNCKVGYGVLVKGTANSDVTCKPCPEGTFSDTVSYTDVCKPHTDCDERDVIRKGNAFSDTECKPAAQQHISKISPGSTVISTAGPLRPTNTTPSVSLSVLTTEMIKPTKSPVPSTGPDKHLGMFDVAVISSATSVGLLFIFIVLLLVFCKRKKADRPKVDANGNCESDNNTNLFNEDTQRLSLMDMGPERQCLLKKLEVCSNQMQCIRSTDDNSSNESIGPQPLTLPLYQPQSFLSEPMTLQSNTDYGVSQTSAATQSSSQPTSPQNMTPSPLVNVNINLHIGNGTCGTPSVMLTDIIPVDPEVPYGEEEVSSSLPQQEAGKLSLTSVEESGSYIDRLAQTLDQHVYQNTC